MKIDKIISELGGPAAVATSLEDGGQPTPAAVSMWLQRGVVPHRWKLSLLTLAQMKNLPVRAGDVGLPLPHPSGRGADAKGRVA